MTQLLTSEERLRQVDETVEEVKKSLVDAIEEGFGPAVEELSPSDEVDAVLADRMQEIGRRLRELPNELEPLAFELQQLHNLHTTLHVIRDLMGTLSVDPNAGGRLDTLNELLIRIEQIRHIIRDALDEHVTGLSTDKGRVLEQIDEWLPSIPRREIARLVDIDRRTLARWAGQAGGPPRRLHLVAKLIAILRHSWTEEGVVAWFDRPSRDLGDRKPITVLPDAGKERALLGAARATRSQNGT